MTRAQMVAAVLRAAAARLATPERWTRGVFARGANGGVCDPNDEHAACWCMLGAIRAEGCDHSVRFAAIEVLESVVGWSPARANDHPATTHAVVLRWLAEAAARAEAGA